ncbi:TRAP transporter small permease [Consotaella aegiceratis]|uniref:TRAP transporter small permease n=1 Tax=Consotaella aegiceratis TaxID=3097961 RepID=UPI002F3E71D0
MRTLYRYVLKVEVVLAGFFLLAMAALIFVGGTARMMHHPMNWTIDMATCAFAWACFLCADIAWRNDSLMAIEVVTERMRPSARRIVGYVSDAIIIGFLCYVIYAGGWLAWVSRARSFQGIPWISYSWVTASLPVGAVLLLISTVLKIRRASLGETTPADLPSHPEV